MRTLGGAAPEEDKALEALGAGGVSECIAAEEVEAAGLGGGGACAGGLGGALLALELEAEAEGCGTLELALDEEDDEELEALEEAEAAALPLDAGLKAAKSLSTRANAACELSSVRCRVLTTCGRNPLSWRCSIARSDASVDLYSASAVGTTNSDSASAAVPAPAPAAALELGAAALREAELGSALEELAAGAEADSAASDGRSGSNSLASDRMALS